MRSMMIVEAPLASTAFNVQTVIAKLRHSAATAVVVNAMSKLGNAVRNNPLPAYPRAKYVATQYNDPLAYRWTPTARGILRWIQRCFEGRISF